MRCLFAHLRDYRWEAVCAPLFKMLEALFDLFVPLVMSNIINIGILSRDTGYILRQSGLLVLLAVVGLVCSVTAQYFSAKAAVGCAAGLRRSLFRHIQSLGFSEMDAIGPSTLITRMTSDINQVQNGVNLALRLLLRSPFVVFGAVILSFTVDRQMGRIFLAALPVLAVIIFGVMFASAPVYRKVQAKLDDLLSVTRENLTGVRVVRAFHREDAEEALFRAANDVLTRTQLRAGRISSLMNPLTYLVVNLAVIAILQSGAVKVNAGALLPGNVYALISYMSQILIELVKLANLVVLLTRSTACAGRIQSVLDAKPGMVFPEGSNAVEEDPASPAVVFSHVSLQYGTAGSESLTDLSFTALRGQTIGIIGGTGSGKSSLVNLIPRFYDATSGSVTLLGRPAADWPRKALRERVAVVPQRAQLFSGTIRSNLAFGCLDATDDMLWSALETAQAADFVRQKPGGLDEAVEQGGRNFSGGQRQRLTIARALVTHPEILILDDSASALDFATDAALRKALAALPGDMTVFLVSQRSSSLQHADQILVLDDGRLVGCGTHSQLLETCGTYREIYESQFRRGEDTV